MKTELSIIIVSYNTRDSLLACLQSIADQDYQGAIEIIVTDNASRDGSADAVARAFPAVKLIRSDTNLGFGNANNRALDIATGRYIVLLNPDALLATDVLKKAVLAMDADANVGMAGARLVGTNGEWQPSARMFPSLINEILVLSGLSGRFPKSRWLGRVDRSWADPLQAADVDWVTGAFGIIRRDLIDTLGFFDPRYFLYYEEVDFCHRIRKQAWRICYWPELVVTHLGGESAKTVTHVEFNSNGSQIDLWRMYSQLLYYRKWHGAWGAWSVMALEQAWHSIRVAKNQRSAPAKAAASKAIIQKWRQAWLDTQGGKQSPPQPW